MILLFFIVGIMCGSSYRRAEFSEKMQNVLNELINERAKSHYATDYWQGINDSIDVIAEEFSNYGKVKKLKK